MSVNDCGLINLSRIDSESGSLTFIENTDLLCFEMKRVYYIYDVPSNAERGAHAHHALHQLIIAVSGSFDIELDDGTNKKIITLNQPNTGLYLCPMIWRALSNFSENDVCLVLASAAYDEKDYLRQYSEFTDAVSKVGSE